MVPQRSTPDPAELRTVVARLRAESEAIRTSAEQMRDSARRRLAQSREERDRALAELARTARDGELGAPTQRLAQRVAADETSWLDVLHGRDQSGEASVVRDSAGASIASLVDELAAHDPDLARATGRDRRGSSRDAST